MGRLRVFQRVFQPLILLSMIFFLAVSSEPATKRGVRVITGNGEALSFYTDYYALVIGVGHYTKGWPELPGRRGRSAEELRF